MKKTLKNLHKMMDETKRKPTLEDVIKRLDSFERVYWENEYKKIYPNGTFQYPPPSQQYHYHNGMICYLNPCVWC